MNEHFWDVLAKAGGIFFVLVVVVVLLCVFGIIIIENVGNYNQRKIDEKFLNDVTEFRKDFDSK